MGNINIYEKRLFWALFTNSINQPWLFQDSYHNGLPEFKTMVVLVHVIVSQDAQVSY